MPELTIEEIAEIRNVLQVIQSNAQVVMYDFPLIGICSIMNIIEKQVKRIDKLLPVIKFERDPK